MKFRCDRDGLSEALQIVQRGVSSRPGIPALTGVLLDATEDGTLTLTSGNGPRAGAAAHRHGEVAVGGPRGLRDGSVAGPYPLRCL